MTVIYLQHPTHGTKVATMEAEAIHDEEYGWMRYNPAAPAPSPDDEPANGMSRRRGRSRVVKEIADNGDGE